MEPLVGLDRLDSWRASAMNLAAEDRLRPSEALGTSGFPLVSSSSTPILQFYPSPSPP